MAVAFENIKTGIDILRQFLVPKMFTVKLLEFAESEGILSVMRETGNSPVRTFGGGSDNLWTREEFYSAVHRRLGYETGNAVRKRMLAILLDFLEECGHISQKKPGIYTYNADAKTTSPLSSEDMEVMREIFGDQSMFFDKCIEYAGDFLKGKNYLFGFNKGMEDVWNRFLGNYEFSFARDVLLKLMTVDTIPDCNILDLCYGTGHGLERICRDFPDADITAIDFTDDMRPFAMSRLGKVASKVKWIDAGRWNGFGSNLPFEVMVFDMIFFSCGDPYIPEHLREGVYRDIFRVLKPGGILGVIAWGYPDRSKRHIQNEWVRRGIYIHDFAESVCNGWHGFRDIDSTIKMTRKIGFVGANAVFNNFYMLDSAVWMFKRPEV
ncbi:MAG: methyltransferase domain-containing protein [Deltaproteobacteria bacterium]|nr:methyltransferase domain-containing protein [Deltaproteobacteria bacterium]